MRKKNRRLTLGRKSESQVGGVCAGLGEYFEMDPILFRIIFLVLLFGSGAGLIPYFIMWVAMPYHPRG